jgi:hypothetical protein
VIWASAAAADATTRWTYNSVQIKDRSKNPLQLKARYSHPSKSEHPRERYTMNESRTRTGRIFERLAAIWQDTSYASQRLTAINRPWIAQRTSGSRQLV